MTSHDVRRAAGGGRRKKRRPWFRFLVALASLTAHDAVHAAAAHAHGKAELRIAQDGGTLTFELTSPLEDLVGFERAPRNDKERSAVRRMAERLHEAEKLFVPTPEARCTRAAVDLSSPVLPPALLAAGEAKGQASSPAAKSDGGHAELTAEIVFRCAEPAKLRGVEVRLFDAFPQLKRIDARAAAGGKQVAAELTARRRTIAW